MISTVIVLLAVCLVAGLAQRCRFAHHYTAAEIQHDPEPFLEEFLHWQVKFMKHVGIQNNTGLTYDGYRLNIDTGELLPGGLHYWTASSKQSIQLGILAKCLWTDNFDIYSQEEIFTLLEKKTITYEQFHQQYPGFGGYLPWLYLNGSKPYPTTDFKSRVPALDNGEMFWAAVAVYHAWQLRYPSRQADLRERFADITWRIMAKNARKIFFNESTTKIRAVSDIKNISLPVEDNQYSNNDNYYLDDPYEGQLFNWVATLYEQAEFSQQQIDFMWTDKRNKLKSINYITSKLKQITVEKGWWFSAHEQWKHLFMPYQDVPIYREIMENKQKARTWYSVDHHICGMYASVTGPANNNTENMDYYSDCGIQSISFNKVNHNMMVTPYSAYPVILVNRTVGALWLHNMLYSPSGQTIYGAVQATSIDGKMVSPVMTWDSKITTVLALLGGNSDIVRDYLQKQNKYQKFKEILTREYQLAFPDIQGKQESLALPSIKVSRGRNDFPNCKR